MPRYRAYKIVIWILSFVVIIQGIVILMLTKPKMIPRIPVVIKGNIAIVIDDWGYNLSNLRILDGIKYPLTLSVLPNLNYSKTIASKLSKQGFEIILHLPMEPHEELPLEKDTIMTSMDESTIRSIIKKGLSSVVNAKGISNHMGSKATEDLRTMSIVFKEAKRRHLFFLDTVVSSDSVGFDLADRMNLGFVSRDVFLDNKEDPQYIKEQIERLKTRARIYGKAIGIGHDKKITLEVLKEVMPSIEKEGYKFVFVSELVK